MLFSTIFGQNYWIDLIQSTHVCSRFMIEMAAINHSLPPKILSIEAICLKKKKNNFVQLYPMLPRADFHLFTENIVKVIDWAHHCIFMNARKHQFDGQMHWWCGASRFIVSIGNFCERTMWSSIVPQPSIHSSCRHYFILIHGESTKWAFKI